jgi:uncharacterized damage-inducible protein DinB
MRLDPDPAGSEAELLAQYLDYQRATVLTKTESLDTQQLAYQHAPSSLTLAGLLYHLADVEESWMEVRFLGLAEREPFAGADLDADPDWAFHAAVKLDPEEVRQRYRDACDRSRKVVAAAADLDQQSVATFPDGRHFSLRWVLLHLIEETARHAGHADLLREAIDGSVGE